MPIKNLRDCSMTTTFKTPTDFRKSLEARLKSIANKTDQDLQRVRRKVAFDRNGNLCIRLLLMNVE